jgi:transcriptional regulator with XRE-family HTH domain
LSDIGERIATARKRADLSQNDLGKLIGVSQSFIYKLESGIKNPSVETLQKLSSALKVTLDYFMNKNVVEIPDEKLPATAHKFVNYAVVVDKAIDANITPEELEGYIQLIKEIKKKQGI